MNMVETDTETTQMTEEPRVRYRERRTEQPVRRGVGGRDIGLMLAIGLALAGIASAAYFAVRLNQSEIDRTALTNKLNGLEKAPAAEQKEGDDAGTGHDSAHDADKFHVKIDDGSDTETPQPPAPVADPTTDPTADAPVDPTKVAFVQDPVKATAKETGHEPEDGHAHSEKTGGDGTNEPTKADPTTKPVEVADAPQPPTVIIEPPQPPVPLETQEQPNAESQPAAIADLAAANLEIVRLKQLLVAEQTKRSQDAEGYQKTIEELHNQIIGMKEQVAERDELEKSLLKATADTVKVQNELGELNRKIVAARSGQTVAKKAVGDAPEYGTAVSSEPETFVYPYTYPYYYPGTIQTESLPLYWIYPN